VKTPELTAKEGEGNIQLPNDWNQSDVRARRALLADWVWHLAYVWGETILEQQSGEFAVPDVGPDIEYAKSLWLKEFGEFPTLYTEDE
jgi:hypothetical protein